MDTKDAKYYRVIPINEVRQAFGNKCNPELTPISIHRDTERRLKTNLIVPPKYQAYSLAIEYMSKWFYSKRPKDFFKHTFLDASHIMDQFRKLKTRELIKANKPLAHITVNEDTEFNRSNIDLYNLGATLYNNRCRYNDAFYVDREKNTFISMAMRQIKLTFDFSMLFDTKSMQDDVAESCEMYYRANGSQKHYIDIDFPVPKELIGQIAVDSGMCKDGKYSVVKMLKHLNQRSRFPFVYKYNEATGNMEYFMRISHCLVHILTSSIQKDSGNQYSMVMSDYSVKFSCEVRFLAIKFFAYYSLVQREHIHSITKLDSKSFIFGITNLQNIPPVNERGWGWDFKTTYMAHSPEETETFKNGELLSIDISHMNGSFREVIDYTKFNALSPDGFIDIKAFSGTRFVNLSIDWNKMQLNFLEPLPSQEIHFIIYLNKEYINNTMVKNHNYLVDRMEYYNDNIGPEMKLGTSLPSNS